MGKNKEPLAPFTIDSEGGTITDEAFASRVSVLTAQGWASVKNELNSTFMSGASVIIQRMGYSYGHYLGRFAKLSAIKANQKKPLSAKSIMPVLTEASKSHGWGRMTLGGGDFEMGVATVIVKECFFCMHDKKGGTETSCHFLVGLVAGTADELTGMSHRVVETRCIAREDGVCEFKAERVASTSGS